jgi:hypothetical protein
VLRPGSKITGKLTRGKEPLPGASIMAEPVGIDWECRSGKSHLASIGGAIEKGSARATTDAQGRYALDGLWPDACTVAAQINDDVLLFEPLSPELGRTVTAPSDDVDFAVPGMLVHVDVTAAGKPVPDAHVMIDAWARDGMNLRARAMGAPLHKNTAAIYLPAGLELTVLASKDGYDGDVRQLIVPAQPDEMRIALELKPHVDPPPQLLIRLIDPRGRVIDRAQFTLSRPWTQPKVIQATAVDGVFAIRDLTTGYWKIDVHPCGPFNEPRGYCLDASEETNLPDSGEAVELEVHPEPAGRLIVAARDQHGDYVGTNAELQDSEGKTVPILFLHIDETEDGRRTSYSFDDERVVPQPTPVSPALAPGDYRLLLTSDRFPPRTVEFTIEAGKTTDLDVSLADG